MPPVFCVPCSVLTGKGKEKRDFTAEAQRGTRGDEEEQEETQHKGAKTQRSDRIKVKNRHGGA